MQNTKNSQILSGKEYDRLFPKANFKDTTVIHNGNVFKTPLLVKKVVQNSLRDTVLVAPLMVGKTLYDTCRNIWNFAYNHIRYKLDKPFVEQVRTPARSWADRNTGIDCDC